MPMTRKEAKGLLVKLNEFNKISVPSVNKITTRRTDADKPIPNINNNFENLLTLAKYADRLIKNFDDNSKTLKKLLSRKQFQALSAAKKTVQNKRTNFVINVNKYLEEKSIEPTFNTIAVQESNKNVIEPLTAVSKSASVGEEVLIPASMKSINSQRENILDNLNNLQGQTVTDSELKEKKLKGGKIKKIASAFSTSQEINKLSKNFAAALKEYYGSSPLEKSLQKTMLHASLQALLEKLYTKLRNKGNKKLNSKENSDVNIILKNINILNNLEKEFQPEHERTISRADVSSGQTSNNTTESVSVEAKNSTKDFDLSEIEENLDDIIERELAAIKAEAATLLDTKASIEDETEENLDDIIDRQLAEMVAETAEEMKTIEETAPVYLNELSDQRMAGHAAETVLPAAKNQNETKELLLNPVKDEQKAAEFNEAGFSPIKEDNNDEEEFKHLVEESSKIFSKLEKAPLSEVIPLSLAELKKSPFEEQTTASETKMTKTKNNSQDTFKLKEEVAHSSEKDLPKKIQEWKDAVKPSSKSVSKPALPATEIQQWKPANPSSRMGK